MSIPKVIASRLVSSELQERFAALTGDRNPMHVDEVAARRTQAGQQVVHGVHTLLWALESLVASGHIVSGPARVKVKFLKWIYLGDEAALSLDPRTLKVLVLGMPVLTAELTYGEPTVAEPDSLMPSPDAPLNSARERSFADLEGCEGNAFTPSAEDAHAFFPHLAALLGGTTVAEIAACSYIVGMEAPGLHSMFSKFNLTLFPTLEPLPRRTGLRYAVEYRDERFSKVRISVAGRGIAGTLESFVRQPPIEQASMGSVAEHVAPGEFAGMRAMIVGGSRGLGELTAKLIAAGGGKPIVTYAVGKAEAENVARQIERAGAQVEIMQYDVRKPPEPQVTGLPAGITHLFYFATNPIFRPKGDLVSPPILADFMAFYVQGFYDLCRAMLQKGISNLVVYYPSSIAVEDRPAGMTEYAMVKAAGEQMCQDMNQYMPGLRILSTRLPRMRTDQTAGVMPERELDSIEVLLPIVRQMREATSSFASPD